MVRKFPPFRSERKKRSTPEGTPQFTNGISGNQLPHHLTSNRNFRIFSPNGKHPWLHLSKFLAVDQVINRLKTGSSLPTHAHLCHTDLLCKNEPAICCAKMSLREVERWLPSWLPKVFPFIYSFQRSSRELCDRVSIDSLSVESVIFCFEC